MAISEYFEIAQLAQFLIYRLERVELCTIITPAVLKYFVIFEIGAFIHFDLERGNYPPPIG